MRVGFWIEEFERHWRATCIPFRAPRGLCLSDETKNWTPLRSSLNRPSRLDARESTYRARACRFARRCPPRSQTPLPAFRILPRPSVGSRSRRALPGLVEPRFRDRPNRRIGEVIAELGFAKREVVEAAVELARRSGELTGEVLINSGVITGRAAEPRTRRAPRARLHRLLRLHARHGRGEPDRRERREAILGRAGRVPRRAHAARRDGRPGEHPRDRRHLDDDPLRRPSRGRDRRGRRRGHRPHRPRRAPRRHRDRLRGGRRRRRPSPTSKRRPRTPLSSGSSTR